jgi:hypothetical protein
MLRLPPHEVVQVLARFLDVPVLTAFITGAEKQDASVSNHCEIDSIARTKMYAKFLQSLSQRLAITEVAFDQAVQSARNSGSRLCIPQFVEPCRVNVSSREQLVMNDVEHLI